MLLLCCKGLDSVPILPVLFLFFQNSLGSAVGILASAVRLPLEGQCIFHCMVQYVVSLNGAEVVLQCFSLFCSRKNSLWENQGVF